MDGVRLFSCSSIEVQAFWQRRFAKPIPGRPDPTSRRLDHGRTGLSPACPLTDHHPRVGLVYSSNTSTEIGDTQRFLQGTKWDKRRRLYSSPNLRDARYYLVQAANRMCQEILDYAGCYAGKYCEVPKHQRKRALP